MSTRAAAFMERFGIEKSSAICDLGCGPGQMAYALHKRGYADLCAMDPNDEWITGTGYLKSIAGDVIDVLNDLNRWRETSSRFDAILSTATIHHWQHIPLVALDARRAMKPGAFWFAFREFFANSPSEFVSAIKGHMTATHLGSYEWAYPSSVYVDLIQSVGFALAAVAPYFYRNNELTGVMRAAPADIDIEVLNREVDEGLVRPNGTVERFWEEVDLFRRQEHGNRIFTQPQVLVFQRVAV